MRPSGKNFAVTAVHIQGVWRDIRVGEVIGLESRQVLYLAHELSDPGLTPMFCWLERALLENFCPLESPSGIMTTWPFPESHLSGQRKRSSVIARNSHVEKISNLY